MVKDSLRFFPLKGEAILAQGRLEARLGVPLVGRSYLNAKGHAIHLDELSFVEVLLGRRVAGKGEGEVRLMGDVRFPADLNGRVSCGPRTGLWNPSCLLPGSAPFLFSPSAPSSLFKKECCS